MARLDDLTASTIHGFCQSLIQAHAVDADLDPGAQVMDAAQADAMFETVFTRWLTERLSVAATSDDPVGVLAEDDPLGVVETLRELAQLRRRHPAARPPPVDLSQRPDIDFVQAVDDFGRWFAGAPAETKTAEILEQLQTLAAFYTGVLEVRPDFAGLWQLTRLPRQPFMKERSYEWRAYVCQGAWRALAGADAGLTFSAAAEAHYESCRAALSILLGKLAGAMVLDLSAALDGALEAYGRQKRAAAVLDFDDLLAGTRDLILRHSTVRRAIGRRYTHLLVDEFQDTDPVQAEIIFSLAADDLADPWTSARVRPGSLFLVGDPKQAIYRFRGAHVGSYNAIRAAFVQADPESIVQITANFRSARQILDHVNSAFAAPLGKSQQPGYVALSATLEAPEEGPPCAAKITIETPPASSAAAQRDEEATAIAELCRRLVGAIDVRRPDGSRSPLRPGDIALLAPTGTELWRYERELEAVRLSVASQAGRTLMLRQETQDVLALVRVLADPADTLAFGALFRGPLVGLTEAELLAITSGLPCGAEGELSRFTVATDPAHVVHPVAREVLSVLQGLRRLTASNTPAAVLGEAFERLKVRVSLTLRTGDRSTRALANIDALLQRARGYEVRGLAAFVGDLQADWTARRPAGEGRVDESEDAVALVTIHSAKGLEWPVVIPINTSTQLRGPDRFVHRQADDSLHWIVGGVLPPDLIDAQTEEKQGAARERERLWYVACTRARDLLILPHLPNAGDRSWSRVVNLGQDRLPEFDVKGLSDLPRPRAQGVVNHQTSEVFAEEAARVAAAQRRIVWRRPSEHDPDRTSGLETFGPNPEDLIEIPAPVGAGRIRGIVLHKLMEELLGGELPEEPDDVARRAGQLCNQLAGLEELPESAMPNAEECGETALRTLALPDVAALRPRLRAEVALWASDPDGALLSGRADAVAIEGDQVTVVVDWKSDLAPTPEERAGYVGQLAAYLNATGAPRGALVFMSRAEIIWVQRQDTEGQSA